jgi:hypothetical protein
MAEELRINVVADDKASKTLDGLAKKTDKLEGTKVEIPITADATKAERTVAELIKDTAKLDNDTATIVLAVKAGQVETNLKEVAAQIATLNDPVEINVAIDHASQLKGDLDQLTGKIKELNDTKIDIPVENTRGKLDELGKSASSSKSVLANMVGNSAQDLGSLGGIAGSTGVAIGQMAEYMADARAEGEGFGSIAGNFLKVAGPIAAFAAVLGIVQGVTAANEEQAKKAAQATKEFGDAMASSANDAVGYSNVLQSNTADMGNFVGAVTDGGDVLKQVASNIPLLSGVFEAFGFTLADVGANIPDVFDRIGVSAGQVGRALNGNVNDWNSIDDTLKEAHRQGLISQNDLEQTTKFINQQRSAVQKAEQAQKFHNVTLKDANDIYGELLSKSDPLKQFTERWQTLFDDLKDGKFDTQASADAINFLAEQLGLTVDQVEELARQHMDDIMKDAGKAADDAAKNQADFTKNVLDTANAYDKVQGRIDAAKQGIADFDSTSPLNFSEMAVNTVQSFDDIKKAIGDVRDFAKHPLIPTTVKELKGITKERAAVVGAVGDMRDAIQTELGAALQSGGGDFQAFTDKAAFFRGEITDQFTKQFEKMGLGPVQATTKVNELLSALGLLPDQVETQIKLSKDDEALKKLQLFSSAIADLPPEIQAKVAAQVEEGSPQEAWKTAYNGIQDQGNITIDTEVGAPPNISHARSDAQEDFNRLPPVIIPTKMGKPTVGAFSEGGTVGDGGGVAGEAGPEIIHLPDGRRAIVAGATFVPPGTVVTSTSATARQLGNTTVPSIVNNTINVNVPRGYRELDAAKAAARIAKRSGRLYAPTA